jgi:hypothetical protein
MLTCVYFKILLMIAGIFANLPTIPNKEGHVVAVVRPTAAGGTGDQAGIGAANFTTADLAWERCQEQAALAYRGGNIIAASRLWAEALEIATRHFGRGDPRLAASLTNQALMMRRRGEILQARRLFEGAFVVWADSWRWILLMTPGHPSRPRRSAQSDQLEIYDSTARAYFTALVERGRAATEQLERYDEPPREGLAEWLDLKPKRLSDLRKLLAAVLLIAPAPHRSRIADSEG